jgi:hypothetical protein
MSENIKKKPKPKKKPRKKSKLDIFGTYIGNKIGYNR